MDLRLGKFAYAYRVQLGTQWHEKRDRTPEAPNFRYESVNPGATASNPAAVSHVLGRSAAETN